jgi:hypothetical protein
MRRRREALIALLVVALAGGTAIWRAGADHEPRLAGAELLADPRGPADLMGAATSGGPVDANLDDFPMVLTTMVVPGPGDKVILLAEGREVLVQTTAAGAVDRVGLGFTMFVTAMNVEEDGLFARAHGDKVTTTGSDWFVVGNPEFVARFEVGAIVPVTEETVIVGSRHDPVIDRLSSDGSVSRLLGPAGDAEARVTTDEPLGPIVALTRLDDGRLVFVADTVDGFQVYVLDDETVRPLDADGGILGHLPVPVSGQPDIYELIERKDRLPMTPLTAGTDDQVLTIGLGPGDAPEINLVDVDSGDADLLVRLDGVEPTIAEPISAALAGDDLVFTAEGNIWRLEDAVDG